MPIISLPMPKIARTTVGVRGSTYDVFGDLVPDTDQCYAEMDIKAEDLKKTVGRLQSAITAYKTRTDSKQGFAVRKQQQEDGNWIVGVWAVTKAEKAEAEQDDAAE